MFSQPKSNLKKFLEEKFVGVISFNQTSALRGEELLKKFNIQGDGKKGYKIVGTIALDDQEAPFEGTVLFYERPPTSGAQREFLLSAYGTSQEFVLTSAGPLRIIYSGSLSQQSLFGTPTPPNERPGVNLYGTPVCGFGASPQPTLFSTPQPTGFGAPQPTLFSTQPTLFSTSQPTGFGASQQSGGLFGSASQPIVFASQPTLFGPPQPIVLCAPQPTLFSTPQPNALGESQTGFGASQQAGGLFAASQPIGFCGSQPIGLIGKPSSTQSSQENLKKGGRRSSLDNADITSDQKENNNDKRSVEKPAPLAFFTTASGGFSFGSGEQNATKKSGNAFST